MSQFDGMPDNYPPQPPQPGMPPQPAMPPQPGQVAPPGVPPQPGMAPGMQQPGAAGLDPAMIQRIMALAGQQQKQAAVNRQFDLADKLRAGIPKMAASQSPINTPNWMGALAGVAGGYRANQMEKQGKADQSALDAQTQQARMDFFNQLRRQGGASPDAAAGVTPADWGG